MIQSLILFALFIGIIIFLFKNWKIDNDTCDTSNCDICIYECPNREKDKDEE